MKKRRGIIHGARCNIATRSKNAVAGAHGAALQHCHRDTQLAAADACANAKFKR